MAFFFKGGYAPLTLGARFRGNPRISPALDAPEPVDPRTGLRLDQQRAAHQPVVTFHQGAHNGPFREYQTTAPSRWPGPIAYLPRQFAPNLGALSGMQQWGFHQDRGRFGVFPHLYPHPELRQYHSAATVTARYNRVAGQMAVPGVFVPTSPANFYGSHAT